MLIIAHRGASKTGPENTLRAFKKAIEIKASMIEFDVRMCKSKELVIIHDKKINRTSNGKGKVKNLSLEELKKYDFGKGEKIPTLEEALKLIKNKTKINIEIKDKGIVKEVIKLFKKYNIKNYIISSFYASEIRKVRKLNKKIDTELLLDKKDKLFRIYRAKRIGANYLGINVKDINENIINKAYENNMSIFVWGATHKDIESIRNIGVDGVFVNL